MEIPLTQGKVAIIDPEDFERVSKYKWCASLQHGKWYACSNSVGLPRQTALHRFILGLNRGDSGVDHINGDGLDNRRTNLRLATQSQNLANRDKPANTSSQYRGVTWLSSNKKWQAQIKTDRGNKYLGSFVNETDAARAYDKAALEVFGEFARTNF